MRDCLRGAPPDGYLWEQSVDMPLLGVHFVSFWAHGE